MCHIRPSHKKKIKKRNFHNQFGSTFNFMISAMKDYLAVPISSLNNILQVVLGYMIPVAQKNHQPDCILFISRVRRVTW